MSIRESNVNPLLMLTKDIAVKASTFRREGFRKFTEVSMSRRYIKNAIFLFLFACLTIAVYTVFLNIKKGAKRGGVDGFVQNMMVHNGHLHDSDKLLDDSKTYLLDDGRNLQEDFRNAHDTNRKVPWPPEVKDSQNEADVHNDNQNEADVHNDYQNEADVHNDNQNEADVHNDNQNEAVGYEDNQDEAFGRKEDEIPINNAIDLRDDENDDDVEEGNNEKNENVEIPHVDPEEVRVRDEEGNIVGYKLFPHGIHPDHNKPQEERERDLRRRLGLPPKEVKKPKETEPEMPKEPQKPNALPRQQIINVGDSHEKGDKPVREIDNLGAFRLKEKVPNKVDGFLRQDDFNDGFDDEFGDDNMEDNRKNYRGPLGSQNQLEGDAQVDDTILDDRFVVGKNPPFGGHDGRLQPENRARQMFPPRDSFGAHNKAYPERAYPDRFAPRNGLENRVQGNVNPNRYGIANRRPIIRPIGNQGMNPFHLGQQEGLDGGMADQMPQRSGMAPFANGQRMPGNFLQNAPMFKNRMVPFQGAVPNDNKAMDPFGQQNGDVRRDPSHDVPVNNGGMDAFGQNQERMNDPIPGGSKNKYPFAPRNGGVREDLLDKDQLSSEEIKPFAPTYTGNKNNKVLPMPWNDGIKPGVELPQDGQEDLIDGDLISHTTESKPSPVLNPMPVEEKVEPETPLDIKDISKPLPISLDCIPFLFPPKKGTLCVHESQHDKALSGVIKARGVWEPTMLAGFFAILKAHPELNVVDIGAGIGVYTITAAMMDRKVVAVEPLYLNYRMLHKSALDNKVSDKITLVAQAIGRESYLGHLKYSDDSGGYSQVQIDKISGDQAKGDSPDVVQVTTMNNLVQAIPFHSAVLKIDVGGFMEPDVLTSSSKFFQALKVPYVLTHWKFDTDVMKKIQLASLLSQKGYHPRTEWNGPNLQPNALQEDFNYLIWVL